MMGRTMRPSAKRRAGGMVFAAVFALTAIPFSIANTVQTGSGVPSRLPTDVGPSRYYVTLQVVPAQDRFSGVVDIIIDTKTQRDVIWLHGKDFNVKQVYVEPVASSTEFGDDGPSGVVPESQISAKWEQADEQGMSAIKLAKPIGPGKARIHIEYDAPFNRRIVGLYRVDNGGESYAFTDFEPSDARQMIPSFDEPSFKAVFDVSAIVKQEHVAVSNTSVKSETPLGNGMKKVRFNPTTKLSTYLLALAVGPLDIVAGQPIPPNEFRKDPLPFRCISAKGKGSLLAYALEHTPSILTWQEKYFGIAYPFDKLDLIAVPDYAAGAMENAGLITFRETRLLLDPKTAPESQRRAVDGVISHELAHMWFGDLVTMAWWDDLWLNEGFASWMGSRTVFALFPEYHTDVSSLNSIHEAMRSDSLSSARVVRQPIESHHDVQNAFDGITYRKGSSLLGMFERWSDPAKFQKGIHEYLMEHRFGNAESDDFLAAVSESSGKDVSGPFKSFLMQSGVPLVSASVVCEGKPYVALQQSRYLPLGSTADTKRMWQIPVCVRYEADGKAQEACTLLDAKEGRLELATSSCPTWVLPNAAGRGYYRWTMPAKDFEALGTKGWPSLTSAERLSLADALESGMDSGAIAAKDAFGAIAQFLEDGSSYVASAPISMLVFAREQLADETLRPKVESFTRKLYRPLYERLGWTAQAGADGESALLREKVLELLVFTGKDRDVLAEAAKRGREFLGVGGDGKLHQQAVAPELVDMSLAAAVEEGGAPVFDVLNTHLDQAQDALLRTQILRAMGTTTDPALATRARALALDPRLRVNEAMLPLQAQMARPETREATWVWLQANIDAVLGRLGKQLNRQVLGVPAKLCDAGSAEAVQAFFAPRVEQISGGPRSLANTVESIRLCAARADAQRASAREFFEAQSN